MSDTVVDSSVVVKWILPEADSAQAQRLLRPALEIAAQYHRAVYDALFVALVDDLGLTGVTADEPLHAAVHTDHPRVIRLRDL